MINNMEYSIKNNTTFSARKLEIRQADKIMRNMMNLYPSQSVSRVRLYNIANKEDVDLEKKLEAIVLKLVQVRLKRAQVLRKNYLNEVINDVRKYKVANCGELALLAKGAFLANGFNDLKIAALNFKHKFNGCDNTYDLDHCFLLVNGGKDARTDSINSFDKHTIVVDAWMGFVDYIQPALNRYRDKFLCTYKAKNKDFVFSKAEIPEALDDTCKKFKTQHPEFIV